LRFAKGANFRKTPEQACAQDNQSLFFILMRIEKLSQTVFTPLADGTGVLLNLDTLFYYSLNSTASILWQEIEANKALNFDDLLRSACEKFDVDEESARPSISTFVERLEQFKMIRTG
jgi:hypothetical protein